MAPKVTDEYRQNVREKILATASRLFARNGYHATSMDDIVCECSLSKGAIYGHFKSKEDLFLDISDKQLESVISSMRAAFSEKDSAKEKLMKAAEMHFRQIRNPNDVWCVTLEYWVESSKVPSFEKRVQRRYDMAHKFLAEIIEEGKKKGEFRKDVDSDALSSVLLATVRGLAVHLRMGTEFDWHKIRGTIMSVIFNGIAAKPTI